MNWHSLVFIISGIILIVFPTIYAFVAPTNIRKQSFAYQTYHKVEAEVVYSELRPMDSSARYIPYIRYKYQAKEHIYISDRISYVGYYPYEENKGKALLAKYPTGAKIFAYYNSENPLESVLDRSRPDTKSIWLLLIVTSFVGIRFIVAGVYEK